MSRQQRSADNAIYFQNYFWTMSVEDQIGVGGSCRVYKGQDRVTGNPVAVKVYHPTANVSDAIKETTIVEQFDHEYILKIYAHGRVEELHSHVVIMELCSAGDLEKMLTMPQNAKGLSDKEFLLLLSCLYNAEKQLRSKDVIHRDIKPLNICCHVSDERKKCFKLIDFGGARKLREGEIAYTITGTEEFCHPYMYDRAFFVPQSEKNRRGEGVYIELWPTGVTLYRAATAQLPFRPFNYKRGDRMCRETLLDMGQKKARGVIAAEQSEDKKIKWFYRLPRDITLSLSLSQLITPMLARLLECAEENTASFDEYFSMCEDILSRRCVRLFSPRDGRIQKAYLKEITSASLLSEFEMLWREAEPGDEQKPLPKPRSTEAVQELASSMAVFHNGHRVSAEDQTKFHSSLLAYTNNKEVFLAVQMKAQDWKPNSTLTYPGPPLTQPKSLPDRLETLRGEELRREISRRSKYLWKVYRKVKAIRSALELYNVAVDNLSNDLNGKLYSAVCCSRFYKLFDPSHSALLELESMAENFLSKNLGYATWLSKVKKIEKIPTSNVNVGKMPRVADDLLKKANDSQDKLVGHLRRVAKMLEDLHGCYEAERQYFLELRVAFHQWMREVYLHYGTTLHNFETEFAQMKERMEAKTRDRDSLDGRSPPHENKVTMDEAGLQAIMLSLNETMMKARMFANTAMKLNNSMNDDSSQ